MRKLYFKIRWVISYVIVCKRLYRHYSGGVFRPTKFTARFHKGSPIEML